MMNYAMRVLEIGMALKCLLFLCRSPCYSTFMSLLKFLLAVLYCRSNKSKYCLELVRYLVHQVAVFTRKEGHEMFYRQFVNTNGTLYGHIPADLQNEYVVREEKRGMKHMFGGKTNRNIERRSAALAGASEIATHFDCETNVLIRSKKHSNVSSVNDEYEVIADLRTIRPFQYTLNRKHKGTLCVKASCLSDLDLNVFLSWIYSKQLIYCREVGK